MNNAMELKNRKHKKKKTKTKNKYVNGIILKIFFVET